MTGIGIILIILQLGPFLGQATPSGGVVGTVESLPALLSNIQPAETMLALLTFALLVFFPQRMRRYLPPQLVALVVGTLVSIFLLSDMEIRRIGEIPTGLPDLQLPVFTAAEWQLMVIDALVLAVLGSIDALLTSVIAENLTRKESNANKELLGQVRVSEISPPVCLAAFPAPAQPWVRWSISRPAAVPHCQALLVPPYS
jgi:SulP family sulfate permease